jgi:pimeloyl-ACP methyl ester carboxylesterase
MRRVRRVAAWLVVVVVALAALGAAGAELYNAFVPYRTYAPRELYSGPFVRLDGRLVSYRSWGASGTPILLIPGFAEPTFVFDRLGPLLARGHRVYAVDLAGFGYTERRGPYGIAGWADELQAFMRRFRVERPLVVGHSLGAAVAVEVARRVSTRGVVLVDGDALRGGGPADLLQDLVVEPYRTAAFRLAVGSDRLIRHVLSDAYGPLQPRVSRAEIDAWRRPFHVQGAEQALWSIASEGVPGFTLAELARVPLRALVVWGALDDIDSLELGRRAAGALNAPVVVLPRGGHLTPLLLPHQLAAAVERFDRR